MERQSLKRSMVVIEPEEGAEERPQPAKPRELERRMAAAMREIVVRSGRRGNARGSMMDDGTGLAAGGV